MNDIIIYQDCPVCRSNRIQEVLRVKDFTVSGKSFAVWQCNDCTCRFTQNVPDAGGIGAFYRSDAYVSHSDTRKGLVNKLYHIVRNYTIPRKRKLVEKINHGKKGSLLDVGAGIGTFASVMQRSGWSVTGLEPDPTARENAAKNYRLQLEHPDSLFSFHDAQFDVITLWHVLEHTHNLHGYIEAFQRLLKNDGTLFIAVPNYTSYDASVYREFWAAYDVPRHLYHFSPLAMQRLLNVHGFRIIQFKPMWFDSFYVAMLSEQYKKGHGNMVNTLWNGFVSNVKAAGDFTKCSSVIYVAKKIPPDERAE